MARRLVSLCVAVSLSLVGSSSPAQSTTQSGSTVAPGAKKPTEVPNVRAAQKISSASKSSLAPGTLQLRAEATRSTPLQAHLNTLALRDLPASASDDQHCSEPPKHSPAKNQTSSEDRHLEQRGPSPRKEDGRREDGRREDGRRENGRTEGKDAHGDGPREGGRGGGNRGDQGERDSAWRARFLIDAMRRNGGSLEFMPLLLTPEIRQEIGIDDDQFKQKLERFTTELQQKLEADRKAADATPGTNRFQKFSERLAQENVRFEKFIDELSEEQRDRLIGIFVQLRNYRSLSNPLVSERKLGMNREESTKLRKEIDDIREETMSAARDRFKRIFENGGDLGKLVRENQEKIDARIKKKLTEAQLQKLQSLRGKEVDQELLHNIEMKPPALPPVQPAPKPDR